MGNRDVRVLLDQRAGADRADLIQKLDWSDPRVLKVKVTGEREPRELGRLLMPWASNDPRAEHFSTTATPYTMGVGRLHAIAHSSQLGGSWMLTFEIDEEAGEASWVRTELGGITSAAVAYHDDQEDEEDDPDALIGIVTGVHRAGEIFDAHKESEKW